MSEHVEHVEPAFAPPRAGFRGRLAAWSYALRTTNPAPGHTDPVTRWLVATRAAVLPMTLTAGLVAALLAVGRPGLDVGYLVLAVVGVCLAHLANNLMNDLFDTGAGSDTDSYPRALYAPHPILSGLVTRRAMVGATLLVNLADLVILVVLAAARGWPVVAFALGGFGLSVAYTAPPLRLKKRGLGEPDVLVVWGPLMVAGTYYSAVGNLPWQVWLASVPYGLLCTAVLMGKHIDKARFDRELGIGTLPVRLGDGPARAVTRVLTVAFYPLLVLCVLVGAMPWPALLAFGAAGSAVRAWRALGAGVPERRPADFPVWPLWFAAIEFVHTRLAGVLLVVGLAVAAVFGLG
ncbi:MAG TPA: prenyltransferase [Mycobacteriales bacterium]|nr:prenyltransferase [Mycobacteriales bacterium]